MSVNIVTLLALSAAISGTAATLAFMSGWGIIGAFVIYSLGGSTTLLLLAGVATWMNGFGPETDQST